MRPVLAFTFCCGLITVLAASCGGGRATPLVTIEPLATSTVRAISAFGGKPAAPPNGSPVSEATTEAAPQRATDGRRTETPAPDGASDSADRSATPDLAPTIGRWIDVNVSRLSVRLMEGRNATREIAPVAVGEQVDTGDYASTQTGLFHVYNKVADLAYDPPYGTYISNWVGFDPDKANGFHSFLKDKNGNVVDASTGRISNGCIRTGAEEALFAFAEIGMPVWVHL